MRRFFALAGVGVATGFFSGLFGVGGGVVLVPLLILVLGLSQRLASGTSLAAVLPTAIAGLAGYTVSGNVDWLAGLVIAAGAIGGSVLGTWLLHRMPQRLLRWLFIIFLVLMAVRMFFLVPDRSAELALSLPVAGALFALGAVVGILSGLLGIGGGVIVVPALILLFGSSDLIAKGTSLLVIAPTAVAGTISNAMRRNVDVSAAAVVGLLAIPSSIAGVAVSVIMPPMLGSILFALLLVVSAVQLAWKAWLERRSNE